MLSDEIAFSNDEFSYVHLLTMESIRNGFIVVGELLCYSASDDLEHACTSQLTTTSSHSTPFLQPRTVPLRL